MTDCALQWLNHCYHTYFPMDLSTVTSRYAISVYVYVTLVY